MRRRPVSVLTNAHSARIALRKNCRMSARTVVAALRRDRSAQRQNGAQGFHSRSGRPQQSESTCPTVPMISRLTRHGLSTYRRKTVDVRCWHIADLGLSHRTVCLGPKADMNNMRCGEGARTLASQQRPKSLAPGRQRNDNTVSRASVRTGSRSWIDHYCHCIPRTRECG